MTISVRKAGAVHQVSALYVRQAGQVKRVAEAFCKQDGEWKPLIAIPAITAPPAASKNFFCFGNTSADCPLKSNVARQVVATFSGEGSYTASWAYVSGDVEILGYDLNTMSPTFRASPNRNVGFSATWRLTVLYGGRAYTHDCVISLRYDYESA